MSVTDAERTARIDWSTVVEPGDRVAGALVDGLGADTAWRLAAACVRSGEPGALVAACIDAGLLAAPDVGAWTDALRLGIGRWAPRWHGRADGAPLSTAATVGARAVVRGDAEWPAGVDDLGPSAPIVLWVRGPSPAVSRPIDAVAVVGSRANSVYGAECTAEIAATVVDAGRTVVSGGAYGVDAMAHRAAIVAGGRTVAVLAGGVDRFYPAGNTDLLRRVEATGAVIAESPPGTRPTRWRFLQRNRLIAAVSGGTVVVEAGARSGALNTAHHAGELGRPVLAVPGPISSAGSVGCHRLVAAGRAQLLVRPSDAVTGTTPGAEGLEAQPTLLDAVDDPDVLRVVDALGRRRGLTLVDVARRAGLSLDDAEAALALAELQGVARRDDTGWRGGPR